MLHESVVQALKSLHTSALPGPHAPALQASPLVQALPSSQALMLPGSHALLTQASPVVQKLPSSQAALLASFTQPIFLSQLSSVQRLPSLQSMAVPGTQALPPQVSPVVQGLPSLQAR